MASRINKRKPRQGFGMFDEPEKGTVPDAILKQARKSGSLNLTGRGLMEVPASVWRINIDQPKESQNVSMDGNEDRWWDQEPLTKLLLASNGITTLSADIQLLEALTFLDVHDNMITSLPEGLGECAQLQQMNLSHNKLRHLPPWLERLRRVRSLHAAHNHLELLGTGLTRLQMLEDLNLSHNKIQNLPPGMGLLQHLRLLNLSENCLQELPKDIGGLAALEQLDLNNNNLTSLPSEVGKLTRLEQLFVRHNKLTALPKLSGCECLKELQAGNNRLSELSVEQLHHMTSVRVLDLRDNALKEIPQEVTVLEHLQRLDLSNNNISSLPYSLGNMSTLNSLGVDGNPMRSIRRDVITRGTQEILKFLRSRIVDEPELSNSPRIKDTVGQSGVIGGPSGDVDAHDLATSRSLDLSKRQLTTLPLEVVEAAMSAGIVRADLSRNLLTQFPESFVGVSDTLSELNVSFNKLTQLHSDIGLFLALSFLDLSGNQLQTLPTEMNCMHELRELNIAMNKFSAIPEVVYTFRVLETLIVSDNRVAALYVDGLRKLSRLQVLDVANNDIGNVPPELGTLDSLRSLQLGGNTFKIPRPAILAKGTPAVLDYLKSRIVT